MPHKLFTKDKQFSSQFKALLAAREEGQQDISAYVSALIKRVRKEGDAALVSLTGQFDELDLTASGMKITRAQRTKAHKACGKDVVLALEKAATRIESYHRKQLPKDITYSDKEGVQLGWRWTAIDAVGLYVPGGKASYPSSVLMNAVPARVAGVKRLAMVVPTPQGIINPAVLVAAEIAGVDEIYRIGGAHAVAALAYGTDTIAAVDKIVGPGNAYVAEAKRQVYGVVGIDMIAGPSEIVVVADNKNKPHWIAADLLSQAEHDEAAQSILITDDAAFALEVEHAIEEILTTLPRHEIARASWQKHGAVLCVRDLKEAPEIVNQLVPEHLELAVAKPEILAKSIRHAGAIFLGRFTPEAIGDYLAGPSHVLPTSRTARFSSGLSVYDFLKRTSLIGATRESLRALGEAGALLADTEGLNAHALSIRIRL